MADSLQTQIERLEHAMAVLEAQRSLLGDAVVEPALAGLRQQLAALEAQTLTEPTPIEERRLVTILFTDIVGSTQMAEKLDPEEWRETVANLHKSVGNIIARHQGRVAQYLGDGLLAFFGAQESSEYDAENAIRAALEFQNALAQLGAAQPVQIRVGIHTGLVVVGELGTDTHKEFTATGDAMNLAARLQSAAPPGGILISHDTYRYVRGVFDLTPQPPLAVKGKTEPIQTYLVRRAKPRAFRTAARGVAGIETRTVGREREFKALQEAYLDAYEHKRVVWAQLVSEVGVGKSRLLDDTQDWLEFRDETFRLFRARAFTGDSNQPFALVRRMWFDRFQIAEDTPLAQAEAKWVQRFLELRGAEATEAAHMLGLLVGLPFRESPYIGAMRNDPTQVKGRAFVVSRELLGKIREDRPIVILLEDLQWADASSWDWLTEVVLGEQGDWETRREGDAGRERHGDAGRERRGDTETRGRGEGERNGMFVLATARPEWDPPEELARLGVKGDERVPMSPGPPVPASDYSASRYVQIQLTPLSDEATRELARELLQDVEGVPEDAIRLLVERSEGVPYFAEEVVNWFIDRGIIDRSRETWRFVVGRLRESPLPATLQHLLLTRLSSLSDVDLAALQRGAIFGRNFWTGGVEALGVRESVQVFAHLQPRGFVHLQPESSFEGETEWSFYHNLLRDVTYESVLKRERVALHQKAAQWLEEQARRAGRVDEFAGLIGEHCERGGDLSAAAEWYIRAGESAQASSALAEARKFFDRALELLPPIDRERRWRALLGREGVLDLRGEREAQHADIAALLELAGDFDEDARRAEAYFRRASYAGAMGDQRAVLPAADEAIAAAQRAGTLALEARALALKIVPLTRLGEMAAARQAAEETLALAQAAGDEAAIAFAIERVAVHFTESGDLARAVQHFTQVAEMARRLGDRDEEARAMGNLGYTYVQLGLPKLARRSLEQALVWNEARGARRLRAYNLANLGLAYWRSGEGRTARRLEEQALDELRTSGDAFLWAECEMYLGLIAEGAGDNAGAAQRFADAQERFNHIGMNALATDALAGLARCALAQGRLDEARQQASEVWKYLAEHGAERMEFPTRAYLIAADIFDALGPSTPPASAAGSAQDDLARQVIESGYRELIERAEKISDGQWRKSFLENVKEHREMVEMYERSTG